MQSTTIGLLRRSLGQLAEAALDFDVAIEHDRSQPLFYKNRGAVRLDIDDFAGAEDDFTTVIEGGRCEAEVYYGRGTRTRKRNNLCRERKPISQWQ